MIDKENSDFWDELCGSENARALGISDSSPSSLKKYDSWYFGYYPYLQRTISPHISSGVSALEVGLGYGSVSQWMGSIGVNVTGLDIASGPTKMFNERFKNNNLLGNAVIGNVLNPPFKKNSFDLVVAIGSLHHTGNLSAAINQCHGLLKEEGVLVLMVYNAYSYRRWITSFWQTANYFLRELSGYRGTINTSSEEERSRFDKNMSGEGAPYTDWTSRKSLKFLLSKFQDVQVVSNNISDNFPIGKLRSRMIDSSFSKLAGLDLYASARK